MSYGTGFSEEVTSAIPRLVDLVLLFVGATLRARTAVPEVCAALVRRSRQAADELAGDDNWNGREAV